MAEAEAGPPPACLLLRFLCHCQSSLREAAPCEAQHIATQRSRAPAQCSEEWLTAAAPHQTVVRARLPKPLPQAGRLAKLWPLYLFTPWIEDALEVANPHTLQYVNVRVRRGEVWAEMDRQGGLVGGW